MFFNNFDIISPNITFYYNNKKRHLSPLGGLLTIIMIIMSIYIIINYCLHQNFPNSSSLIMYRNFEIDKSNNYFNESGLFHFIWIYKDENIINNNELQLNNLKNGIIRIFMTYSYNNYHYNSSNLQDNDHWVYDTCHHFSNEEDMKYDYSFSSCIKYYYNSIQKKYYSIHDNLNFKWPYLPENLTDIDNAFFTTFIEKCSNKSVLNNILGECYPEEKINEYLLYFNNIFISFINNRIQINNKENPIKKYSYKIYNSLMNCEKYFHIHEMNFIPFNYEESKNILQKYKYNSFMFDGEKTTKIDNKENSNLLLAYIFNFKKYINEFRKQENNILNSFNVVGSSILVIYFIFYIINYLLNERVEVRNFQCFLNDRSHLINRHINYEKNKVYSLKSNLYTNISNEGYDQYNSFKSTYFGNLMKKELNNICNANNNSKVNENNFSINIEKFKNDDKEISKKNDNIIVINNGTFMNDGNGSSNNKLNLTLNNTLDKIKNNNIDNKIQKDLNIVEGYNKTFTYNNNKKEAELLNKGPLVNHKKSSNVVNYSSYFKNKYLDNDNSEKNDTIDYSSKQKIIDTSSISLLNFVNKTKNLYINNSNYNVIQKRETPIFNFEKYSESFSPKNNKLHNKIKSFPKENYSQKDFKFIINHHNENNRKNSISKKNNKKIILRDKNNNNCNYQLTEKFKGRRKSHQARNTFKYDKDNDSDKLKHHKNKNKQKTGIFQSIPDKQKERHLSLFSKNSNIININNNNNNKTFNLYPCDNNSQVNLSKNLIEHYKRIAPLHKFMAKKIEKETISPGSESQSKNQKKDGKNSMKCEHSTKQTNRFTKIVQNINWSPKMFFNYLCLCSSSENNGISLLNKFRHKLLSEEYLYILHFNMLIFKQKFGCKSSLEKMNLLEELYNDY